MNCRSRSAILWFGLLFAGMFLGCQQPAQVAQPNKTAVPVSTPIARSVTDFVDYTGRTNAVNAVDIRARASGYLVQMPFKEGAEVRNGELLFRIDPRPYVAQYNQVKSQLDLYGAQLRLAKATLAMDQALFRTNAISQFQINIDQASVDQADAAVKAFESSLAVFQLNLDYTRVISPIDGQVSRYYLTLGNLVTQDQTLLTTVVSLDPMYVYFDMDQRTLLKAKQAINAGWIKMPEPALPPAAVAASTAGWMGSPLGQGALLAAFDLVPPKTEQGAAPVFMGLEGEDGFPHQGALDFVNNQVNPSTGTIAVRGVFPNPKPSKGTRLLTPGLFVRVRLPLGEPHPALLVIDRAIGSDQGLKYVYVVDGEDKVQYRRIKTGPLQPDGLRVIAEGLKPDERVVVGALQQLRPGLSVNPQLMPMPTLGGEAPPSAPKEPPPPTSGAAKR